jgi:hypothetical protein
MLELGIFVAAADGNVELVEVDHIASFLESQFLLDPPDVRRLEALKQVLLLRHPGISGITRRLQAVLTRSQCDLVGQFLVGVAAANGIVEKCEITALRSAYKALGIDASKLNTLLDKLRRSSLDDTSELKVDGPIPPHPDLSRPPVPAPVLVQLSEGARSLGEAIPVPEEKPDPTALPLNDEVLRRIFHETQEVARLLGEVMRNTEDDFVPGLSVNNPVANPEIALDPQPVGDPRFPGLDVRHHPMLSELLDRDRWSNAELEAMGRRYRLMPCAVLEIVNDWSQAEFGDLIIEEGNREFVMHPHVLSQQRI